MFIGISGAAGSGKDTLALAIHKHAQLNLKKVYISVSLADPMKRICRDVYDFSEEQLWGPSEKRNEPDKRYPRGPCPECGGRGDRVFEDTPPGEPALQPCMECHGEGVQYLTPRYALQLLGTEWGRECYSDTWVALVVRIAKTVLSGEGSYSRLNGLTMPASLVTSGVTVPDVRHKNEIKCVRDAGGVVIRVVRPGAGLSGSYAQHGSESEMAEIPDSEFDFVIQNDGTLGELHSKVSDVMATLASQA